MQYVTEDDFVTVDGNSYPVQLVIKYLEDLQLAIQTDPDTVVELYEGTPNEGPFRNAWLLKLVTVQDSQVRPNYAALSIFHTDLESVKVRLRQAFKAPAQL